MFNLFSCFQSNFLIRSSKLFQRWLNIRNHPESLFRLWWCNTWLIFFSFIIILNNVSNADYTTPGKITWRRHGDVIARRYHVVGKIIPEILGFELASFSEKKSRCVWERQGASFLDKKSNAIYCAQIWGFFEKSYFGNWASVIFGQKKQNTF